MNKLPAITLSFWIMKICATNLGKTAGEIELNQLPKGVLEYVKANYKGQKVKEAAKITDAKGTVTYEAEIKGMDILFDSNGKFIKEIKN
jgi:hypothetical protein